MGFLTMSDTNKAVLPQKMVRGWKLRILELEALYCLCGENKGTDQQTLGCTATEDGLKLEILYFGTRGILLSMWRKQRNSSAAAELPLCFRICKKHVFS